MLRLRMMHAMILMAMLFASVMAQSVCPNPIPMQVNEEDAITVLPQKTVCLQLAFADAQRLVGRSAFFGYSASDHVVDNPIQSLQGTLYNASNSAALGTVGPVSGSEQSANLCLEADQLPPTVWLVLTSQSDSKNIYVNVKVSALDEPVANCNSASFSPFAGCDNPQGILVNNNVWPYVNVTASGSSCWFVALTPDQQQGNVTIGLGGGGPYSGAFRSVSERITTENGTSIGVLAISANETNAMVTYAGDQLPSEFYLLLTNSNATDDAMVTTWVNTWNETGTSPAVSSSGSGGGLGWWWLVIVLVVIVLVLVVVAGVFVFLKKRAAKDDYYADLS